MFSFLSSAPMADFTVLVEFDGLSGLVRFLGGRLLLGLSNLVWFFGGRPSLCLSATGLVWFLGLGDGDLAMVGGFFLGTTGSSSSKSSSSSSILPPRSGTLPLRTRIPGEAELALRQANRKTRRWSARSTFLRLRKYDGSGAISDI